MVELEMVGPGINELAEGGGSLADPGVKILELKNMMRRSDGPHARLPKSDFVLLLRYDERKVEPSERTLGLWGLQKWRCGDIISIEQGPIQKLVIFNAT